MLSSKKCKSSTKKLQVIGIGKNQEKFKTLAKKSKLLSKRCKSSTKNECYRLKNASHRPKIASHRQKKEYKHRLKICKTLTKNIEVVDKFIKLWVSGLIYKNNTHTTHVK